MELFSLAAIFLVIYILRRFLTIQAGKRVKKSDTFSQNLIKKEPLTIFYNISKVAGLTTSSDSMII